MLTFPLILFILLCLSPFLLHARLLPPLPFLDSLQEVLRAVRDKLLHLFSRCEEMIKFGKGTAQREAFLLVVDISVVFARQLRKHARLASLVYMPEPSLQQALQVCLRQHA